VRSRGPMGRPKRPGHGVVQGRRSCWENSMKFRTIFCALCCAVFAACLVSGCSEVNTGQETDLAKLSLPKGVSDKPGSSSFSSNKKNQDLAKQLAKRSSPPIGHH
jgi:hypothetical protein